ncbi:MAG: hypothetical protein AAFO93_10045 [Pseudomonadota bacterium]
MANFDFAPEPGTRRQRARTTVDPALLGDWDHAGYGFSRFTPDGWYWSVGEPATYVIATDNQSFVQTASNGHQTTYSRVYGSGPTLVGVWELIEEDDGEIWREEWTIRADGSYSGAWFVDGVFDSIYVGTMEIGPTSFVSAARNAIVSASGGAVTLDVVFGPTFTGTYTVIDADTFEWTIAGGTQQFTRRP